MHLGEELFDDYEEGLWTPALFDAASGGNEAGLLYTYGVYTKVGRLCRITGAFYINDETGVTAGNTINIRGMPYPPHNIVANDHGGSGTHSNADSNFTEVRPWIARDNGSTIALQCNAAASTTGWVGFTFGDADTNFNGAISITYVTT